MWLVLHGTHYTFPEGTFMGIAEGHTARMMYVVYVPKKSAIYSLNSV